MIKNIPTGNAAIHCQKYPVYSLKIRGRPGTFRLLAMQRKPKKIRVRPRDLLKQIVREIRVPGFNIFPL